MRSCVVQRCTQPNNTHVCAETLTVLHFTCLLSLLAVAARIAGSFILEHIWICQPLHVLPEDLKAQGLSALPGRVTITWKLFIGLLEVLLPQTALAIGELVSGRWAL